MHHRRCVCPHCGRTLRVKDRAYLERPIPCPDCKTLLVLKAVDDDRLEAVLAEEPKIAAPEIEKEKPPRADGEWSRWLTNPKVISWTATLAVAALMAAFAIWPRREPAKPQASVQPSSDVEEMKPIAEPIETAPPEPPLWAAHETDGPEERLERLGLRLNDYLQEHGRWPRQTAQNNGEEPNQSFLVELQQPKTAEEMTAVVPEFLNPKFSVMTMPDGTGVTHFVGVAGVGEDGPQLPADHPRAGIFGTDRGARKEDVTDGLSQTLLMLGVDTNFGPWAAAGPATIRPLTAEPYLHGPDGFGTGQEYGMFALMADGSVKFLDADTHPVLMRRMAAMADGLPLDLSVPGDPAPYVAESEPLDTTPWPPADLPGPEDAPAVAAAEPPKPMIDLDAALAQPLERFRQARGVSRRELLDLMEEMLGAPIRYDAKSLGDAAAALDQPVTFDLQNVTVEDVLKQVLDKSELTFDREKDGLRLRRKDETPNRSDVE